MFGIGIPELIVIFIIALIFIGPKKLPDLARTLARGLTEFKRAAEEVKEELDIKGELANQKEELFKDYKEIVRNVTETIGVEEAKDKEETLEAQTTKKKMIEEDKEGTGGSKLSG
ncbi:MAG: twin-arginine translocase subunit TatB [Deltaproteobacteria bacterium CG12_big_fil_rev_8_21_14_0_65_43_10]|nr:MAG: hypothetical protein AUK23_12260 [Deltaproteobacteria bacterium CG2_30_43_15]PIQ45796.1 MAG: twin-arginine translocase subunit TatB [Deltaproteobacteria bacterium CG12_big_fil_rev_8_21_14_0_65_43_10]PIU85359.1 MAG: twin-arginine translocase subunit TatB [Deltaproteobacteria bacterium CG06_land_8_20_14_3_00_44_19]PIX23036.1 MAG: twin-arginine translocase subunit TatB [Deltaproteobacteria bacterium CG_4_8_14_3_um_filter_43_13]PIZ19908.1 MAG: twin-arginine translocase subunit TatB [Deltapr